jgi:hypothetical protein
VELARGTYDRLRALVDRSLTTVSKELRRAVLAYLEQKRRDALDVSLDELAGRQWPTETSPGPPEPPKSRHRKPRGK